VSTLFDAEKTNKDFLPPRPPCSSPKLLFHEGGGERESLHNTTQRKRNSCQLSSQSLHLIQIQTNGETLEDQLPKEKGDDIEKFACF